MVEVIAHRGFSGNYPENTVLSVRKAVELGVDGVEVDVWLSLDNKVVVIHDMSLNRTTNGRGRVLWKTAEELSKYRTLEKNQPIPLLEDIFPIIKNSSLIKKRVFLNIEIKSMWTARPVAQLIKEYKMEDYVVISSVSPGALRIIRYELPSVKTAYLFYNSPNHLIGGIITALARMNFRLTQAFVLRTAKSLRTDYVNLSYPFVSNGFVKRLHKNGFKVNVWVVNTPSLMKKMINKGVDGIITDYPDKLKRILAAYSYRKKKRRIPGLSKLKSLNDNLKKIKGINKKIRI